MNMHSNSLVRLGALAGLILLGGCGANTQAPVANRVASVPSRATPAPLSPVGDAQGSPNVANRPISVRSPMGAPEGWVVEGSAQPTARLVVYQGQVITELAPIQVTRATATL